MDDLCPRIIEIVRKKGYQRLSAPIELASGELSHDYIDGKRAFAVGADLKLACEGFLAVARETSIDFDAVGGLTLGADQFAHGVALLSERAWFVVRKEIKHHGTKKKIEGADLKPGVKVLLVDDVVTSGGSILEALEEIRKTGAEVVLAVTLVDRGEVARECFRAEGIPYRALVTYRDLGIEPVGLGQGSAQAAG
ncbi:MAG: orotate phosphoribosyltransferase [Acidimicrobiales bacterium]